MTAHSRRCPTPERDAPRRNVFKRLFVSMLAFGTVIGVLFPPFTELILGVDSTMTPVFYVMCVVAGAAVGAMNFMLFNIVVTREISRVAEGMEHINLAVENAEDAGEECREDCLLEVMSNDLIGDLTQCFNNMTEAVGRRVSVESTTRRLLASLSSTVELDEIASDILGVLSTVSGGRAGLLYANTGSKLTLVSSFGVDITDDTPREIGAQHGLAQRALSESSIVWVNPKTDGLDWIEFSCPLGSFRPEALFIAPLVSDQQQLTGLAILAVTQSELTVQQESLVNAIRVAAAPYIQNAVLHRKLEELAAIDELTHILNRRFGVRRLREEFSRASRHGTPLSVMMFDIDHFKAVNDTFGHDAGDVVLQTIASVLEGNVRSGDVVCRYGGEEFLLVAPGMGLNDAIVMAEKLRRTIQSRMIEWQDQVLHVTISAGAVSWPLTKAFSPEELVTSADRALYHAKESGRNKVSIHNGDRVVPAPAPAHDSN